MREPQFEGQTKGKLGSPEIRGYVTQAMNESFAEYLEEHPRDGRAIIEKVALAAKARLAAHAARDSVLRKGALDGFALPGKLADCSQRDPAKSEIFIVEGDSAGGCFSGDTRISLASGQEKTMEELANDWEKGVTHFGYATSSHGDVRIVPLVHPRQTKQNTELIEVELDNGEKIKCTPDHLFRLRDGLYIRADALKAGESLMPLKIRHTTWGENPGQGYEMVWMNNKEEWNHTHHLADRYNLLTKQYTKAAGPMRHHLDFDKKNNDPRNIKRLTKQEHLELHAALASNKFKELWRDPVYRERKIQQASQSAKRQWKDPAYRAYMSAQVKKQRQDPVMTKAVLAGFQHWFKQLTPEQYAAYCQRSQDIFAAYWADEARRVEQSQRTSTYFKNNPQARENNRQKANNQWADKELRQWRSKKTIQQWKANNYREQHSQAVKNWWKEHPEHAEKIQAARQRIWADPIKRQHIVKGLARWREGTTKEERATRIRDGIKLKSLTLLNQVVNTAKPSEAYDALRREKAPTYIRYDRLLNEFYAGDENALLEAARNVNCKVVAARTLPAKADVYDITVDRYHNFALAAGIFVHNSAKSGRDRRFQAILPLRGKILNVERARLDKMLANNEIKALIIAMGTGIGESFEVARLRYHRIIIATDADVDGAHISTLLLTLFFRYFQPLIDGGYLYLAQPPLYKISHNKEASYVYREVEREKLVAGIKKTSPEAKIDIQRYKGLGEMNPIELWETTMNPANRLLKQVTINDAAEADRVFDVLMGNEVAPRKKWIQTHAKTVKNLDV
jgi:DNA gyrase subunit B